MPTEVWTALISGVVGLAAGSVATAWANWGIEKRRLKVKRRYELLDSWRTGIASFDNFDDLKVIGPTPDWYETLRPHLSERSRELIERRAKRATVLPRESRGRKDVIVGEIDRIEREWGLKP